MPRQERRKDWNREVELQRLIRQNYRTELVQRKTRLLVQKRNATPEFIRSDDYQKLCDEIAEINAKLISL
jgi:hypothetical protein